MENKISFLLLYTKILLETKGAAGRIMNLLTKASLLENEHLEVAEMCCPGNKWADEG